MRGNIQVEGTVDRKTAACKLCRVPFGIYAFLINASKSRKSLKLLVAKNLL